MSLRGLALMAVMLVVALTLWFGVFRGGSRAPEAQLKRDTDTEVSGHTVHDSTHQLVRSAALPSDDTHGTGAELADNPPLEPAAQQEAAPVPNLGRIEVPGSMVKVFSMVRACAQEEGVLIEKGLLMPLNDWRAFDLEFRPRHDRMWSLLQERAEIMSGWLDQKIASGDCAHFPPLPSDSTSAERKQRRERIREASKSDPEVTITQRGRGPDQWVVRVHRNEDTRLAAILDAMAEERASMAAVFSVRFGNFGK